VLPFFLGSESAIAKFLGDRVSNLSDFILDAKKAESWSIWYITLRAYVASYLVQEKLLPWNATSEDKDRLFISGAQWFDSSICSKEFRDLRFRLVDQEFEIHDTVGNWNTLSSLSATTTNSSILQFNDGKFNLENNFPEYAVAFHFGGSNDAFDGLLTTQLFDAETKAFKDTCIWIDSKHTPVAGHGRTDLSKEELLALLAKLEAMKRKFPLKQHLLYIFTTRKCSKAIKNLVTPRSDVCVSLVDDDGLCESMGYSLGSLFAPLWHHD
jgi:hypothetical protein